MQAQVHNIQKPIAGNREGLTGDGSLYTGLVSYTPSLIYSLLARLDRHLV